MSAFVLKIIALISMICDHSSYVIFGHFSFLNYIGRIAFPIFAFQISEGYIHTKNLKKYLLRLFVFALISQFPFMLFSSLISSKLSLNIFFTLFLGLISIIIYDKVNKIECKSKFAHYTYNLIGILSAIIIALFATLLNCDYSYYGIAIIFIFYLFKNNKILMNIAFIICTIIYYFKGLIYPPFTVIYSFIILFTCLPLVCINLYNNQKGKDTKYLLYIFYPLHLLALFIIAQLC